MKLYVHRNLNRRCWSVLDRGKLREHRQQITLKDTEFRVRPGGHARTLREGQRNVHAFVVGTLSRGISSGLGVWVRYDRARGAFVTKGARALESAKVVRMDNQGRVKAWGVRYAATSV